MVTYSQGICEDGAAILCDGLPMTVDEIVATLNANTKDAERYRKLRVKSWADREMCVAARSDSIKLGHDTLSLERLDQALDDADQMEYDIYREMVELRGGKARSADGKITLEKFHDGYMVTSPASEMELDDYDEALAYFRGLHRVKANGPSRKTGR